MTSQISKLSCLFAAALMGAGAIRAESTASQHIKSDVDPPALDKIDDTTNINVVPPTNTMQGTRGLSQTASAEALGQGRLVLGLSGPWYRQEKTFPGVPNEKADIFTGVGTIAYGIAPQWDIFASLTAYGSNNYSSSNASGLGTVGGGIQGTLPFERDAPFRMGGQFSVYNGLSNNPINSNYADGYNYFETRTGFDFRALLIQTLVLGSEAQSIKWHFNEGAVTSPSAADPLMLLATGLQFNMPVAAVGLELHSRTSFQNIDIAHDPLWITPSLQFRTGYNLNLSLGGDISMSQDRSGAPVAAERALEPYRLFAGLDFTFDTQAQRRRDEKWEAIRASRERTRLQQEKDEMARKAAADSAAEVAAREDASRDSVAAINRAHQDSIALADARANYEREKSRRSEMENRLLNTGMLVMDAVYFETGKAEISINSKPYLDMVAKMLVKYPKLQIEVGGHTDNIGGDAYNLTLSQQRAQAVEAYLVGKEPELQGRLTARGYGKADPKASNATAQGRQMNRRTELEVTNKLALQEYNQPPGTASTPTGRGGSMNNAGSEVAPDSARSPDNNRSQDNKATPAPRTAPDLQW